MTNYLCRFSLVPLLLLLASCGASPTPARVQSTVVQTPSPAVSPSAGAATDRVPPSAANSTQAPPEAQEPGANTSSAPESPHGTGVACGALDCLAFDRAEDAILSVLEATEPVVLAVGEIHAQKGSELKVTPTAHFGLVLPLFRSRTKHLVLELWTGRNDCGDNRVARVQEAQKPATKTQRSTNQSDFFHLGELSQAQGIMPHALVPSCDDYARILAAKQEDIATMLELTAERTVGVVTELLARKPADAGSPYVVTYGGTMHNDVSPRPGLESFSFAAKLQKLTDGHYVELDLVLREQVRDTGAFKQFAWYSHFRSATVAKRFALYRTHPKSYTLIFPEQ